MNFSRDRAIFFVKTAGVSVSILFSSSQWDEASCEPVLERAVAAVLDHVATEKEVFEVSVMATDDASIAELNAQFRDKPVPTNVLSWPAQDLAPDKPGTRPRAPKADAFGMVPLGDVALAFETCAREAAAQGKTFKDHVTHLTVHGTLHLLGFDHETDADADIMEDLERQILCKLGIDDPY